MFYFKSTSGVLIVISFLIIGASYFLGLATTDKHDIIKFGYNTGFLVLIIGYILRQKNIQQLIGLVFYLVYYNLGILKGELFQIKNNEILYFAKYIAFYVLVVAALFLFPTLFDKYEFAPLTNKTNIKDITIILTAIVLTILIQASIRLLA